MICNKHNENEIWQLFKQKQVIYFASIEEQKPRVRPVTMLCVDDRFWVLTGTSDRKVTQLKANPYMELCLPLEEDGYHGYLRIEGTANIVTDSKTKREIAEKCEYFKDFWKDTNDPGYTLLELEFQEIGYMKPGMHEAEEIKF